MRQQDILFLALTRPPMVFGVTYTFLVVNVLATGLGFIWSKNLWMLLMAAPIHLAGYVSCIRDPRLFDLWYVKLRYALPAQTRFFWGGNSYRP